MILVGLTGGIGSGKSTVAALLAARGAVVIDADQIAREVVEPGGPAYAGVVERFGSDVVGADGSIDRPALAEMVFGDPEALADLGRITHPPIAEVMAGRLREEEGTDHVVVLDVPLLVESTRRQPGMRGLIVVDAPYEVALERLVSERGMKPDDARARMAAQASREERLARADFVVDNGGSRESLEAQIDALMGWIRSLPEGGDTPRR